MKTPFGIHAEYVSNRAVDNCINMFKKEGRRVKPGVLGEEKVIPKFIQLLKEMKTNDKAIIYCKTKNETDNFVLKLKEKNIKAD